MAEKRQAILNALRTENKESLVDAINDVHSKADLVNQGLNQVKALSQSNKAEIGNQISIIDAKTESINQELERVRELSQIDKAKITEQIDEVNKRIETLLIGDESTGPILVNMGIDALKEQEVVIMEGDYTRGVNGKFLLNFLGEQGELNQIEVTEGEIYYGFVQVAHSCTFEYSMAYNHSSTIKIYQDDALIFKETVDGNTFARSPGDDTAFSIIPFSFIAEKAGNVKMEIEYWRSSGETYYNGTYFSAGLIQHKDGTIKGGVSRNIEQLKNAYISEAISTERQHMTSWVNGEYLEEDVMHGWNGNISTYFIDRGSEKERYAVEKGKTYYGFVQVFHYSHTDWESPVSFDYSTTINVKQNGGIISRNIIEGTVEPHQGEDCIVPFSFFAIEDGFIDIDIEYWRSANETDNVGSYLYNGIIQHTSKILKDDNKIKNEYLGVIDSFEEVNMVDFIDGEYLEEPVTDGIKGGFLLNTIGNQHQEFESEGEKKYYGFVQINHSAVAGKSAPYKHYSKVIVAEGGYILNETIIRGENDASSGNENSYSMAPFSFSTSGNDEVLIIVEYWRSSEDTENNATSFVVGMIQYEDGESTNREETPTKEDEDEKFLQFYADDNLDRTNGGPIGPRDHAVEHLGTYNDNSGERVYSFIVEKDTIATISGVLKFKSSDGQVLTMPDGRLFLNEVSASFSIVIGRSVVSEELRYNEMLVVPMEKEVTMTKLVNLSEGEYKIQFYISSGDGKLTNVYPLIGIKGKHIKIPDTQPE